LTDPLSIGSTMKEARHEEGEDETTATEIRRAFGSTGAAIAFLVFILLYTPCAATLGAVYREAGGRWMALTAFWTLAAAWVCSTAVFQLTKIGETTAESAIWLGGITIALVAIFAALRFIGNDRAAREARPVPVSAPRDACH
jgi:ferrous iron transport protein B